MSDPEDGILAISLSDSDAESAGAAREARTGQSAGAFEAVKRAYGAKIEEGEIWKGIGLPLRSPSKQEVQAVLHAVEELYFFGRFGEAVNFLGRVREDAKGLGDEAREMLEGYERRCKERLGSGVE